jgi:hypothetical protein
MFVSCKQSKQFEKPKPTIEKRKVESNIPFYDLFLKYETEQKSLSRLSLNNFDYYKTYVLQGESKIIDRQFEDINPSNILSKEELNKLNYHIVFEGYQWDFSVDRTKFNVDFIERFKFRDRKPKKNKTEIVYFFTYPFSVSEKKVLIGFEVFHKFYPNDINNPIYMGFVIFEKINNNWKIIGQESF